MQTLKLIDPCGDIQPIEPQYTSRASGSTSRITSIARIFGAPVIEPQGNNAVKRSLILNWSSNFARTSETICKTVS